MAETFTPETPAAEPKSKRLMTLNMGPQHPSTHGVLRIVLELDGEVIVDAKCGSRRRRRIRFGAG